MLWVLLAAFSLPWLYGLRLETSAKSLLNQTDPAWQFYERSQRQFGGDEVVVVALKGQEPFDPAVLESVKVISRRLRGIRGVRRVDSLSTVPIVRVRRDLSVDLTPALERDTDGAAPDREKVREIVGVDRIAERVLLSSDGTVFAINILLQHGVSDAAFVVSEIRKVLGSRDFWISGVPIFETEVGPQTRREILLFVPITLAVLAGILGFLFRSGFALLVPLLSSGAGTIAVLAAMSAAGEPLTIIGILLPSILLALGCAYVMHVLTALGDCRGALERRRALQRVSPPIALSGLTTMLGFLAMGIVEIDAIQGIGLYGGFGVFVVTVASLSLAPALVELKPDSLHVPHVSERIRQWGARRLVPVVGRRRWIVIAAWAGAGVVAIVGLRSLNIETDGTRWWSPGSVVRDDYEAIRAKLSGISPMNVVVRSRDGRLVTESSVLRKIDELTEFLASLPEVGKAISIGDPLRQIHGGFSEDADQPLPKENALVAQYLLLLESADHIHDLVSDDRGSANIVLRVDNNGSQDLLRVAEAAEQWWAQHGDADFDAQTTGIMFEFARSEDAIARGQIEGLGFAFGAVLLTLFVVFRRYWIVAVGLLPNVLPLVLVFGGLGLFGVPLDAGTACLGSLAVGIAVDDTIHVLLTWRRNLRGRNEVGVLASLCAAFEEVLPALVYTTVLIAVGFGVIAFSEFSLTRNLGWVTAVVVGLCLLADVTLLPALLATREDSRDSAGRFVA